MDNILDNIHHMKIYIVVENLQLGGYQRLALDQSYSFSKLGYSVSIISMSASDPLDDNFERLEVDLITKYKISIQHCGGGRFRQLIGILKLIDQSDAKQPIIVHSMRASVLIYLIKLLFRRNYQILTTIHQLPSLSAPLQRLKRFIYAQFCDHLFAYSVSVKLDWESRLKGFGVARFLIFSKEINVLRNGIFLDRLPKREKNLVNDTNSIYPRRVIYLGRVTAWKGLSNFYSCVLLPELSKCKILMMIPSVNLGNVKELMEPSAYARTTIVSGKTIVAYKPDPLDIHIYPVEYPRNGKYIESISLNCLEMACLGVRSFVSAGGLGTWPDLADSGIFVEVDWSKINYEIGSRLDSSKDLLSDEKIGKIRAKVDIQNQIDSYLEVFQL